MLTRFIWKAVTPVKNATRRGRPVSLSRAPGGRDGNWGAARSPRAIPIALVLAASILAGCAPSVLQAPPVGELRRHEGPSLPLKAHVLLELRKFEIRGGGPLHTRDILAPPEGVQLARDLVREKITESGLFESVEPFAAEPSADTRGVVLRGVLDIVVTTPAWGVTSFNPHVYLTATHVGAGSARETLFTGAHYETRGTMGDNVFALRETVMLAWRTGGETLATLIANDLPRRIAASALGARLAGKPPAAPETPPRAGARTPLASSGSGFLLKNSNLVLTNYHVVQDKAEIRSFPAERNIAAGSSSGTAATILPSSRAEG
jgi:hypothetical protein